MSSTASPISQPPDAGTRPSPVHGGRAQSRAHFDARELGAVFLGGALGTGLRAALTELVPHSAGAWPWATFAANVLGAFLLGYFATRLQERLPLSAYQRPLLGTGLCGGLTTFSTMQVELMDMLASHAYVLSAGYAVASIASGYVAVQVASALTRRVRVTR